MATIDIKGDIINNEDKLIYNYLGWDSTCANDVKSVIASTPADEMIDVYVNSGGGDVFAGQEIYSALKADKRVNIHIQSLAGSAAGVIAMGGHCSISPVAMIMIHNVSMVGANGDYREMQHNAEVLKKMNEAMAAAYVEKSGKSLDEVLELMNKEAWLTANQCLEYGFVDEIESDNTGNSTLLNSVGTRLTDEIREKVLSEIAQEENDKKELLNDLDLYGV